VLSCFHLHSDPAKTGVEEDVLMPAKRIVLRREESNGAFKGCDVER